MKGSHNKYFFYLGTTYYVYDQNQPDWEFFQHTITVGYLPWARNLKLTLKLLCVHALIVDEGMKWSSSTNAYKLKSVHLSNFQFRSFSLIFIPFQK